VQAASSIGIATPILSRQAGRIEHRYSNAYTEQAGRQTGVPAASSIGIATPILSRQAGRIEHMYSNAYTEQAGRQACRPPVRTAVTKKSASMPAVIHFLTPLTTKNFPHADRAAVVRSCATSDPTKGSVTAWMEEALWRIV